MFNQYLTIKGKLTQSPIFTEEVDGSKFTEITIFHTHKFADKSDNNGSTIEIRTPFILVLNEELSNKVKRLKPENLIEATGAYMQKRNADKKIEHLIFVDSIEKIKDTKKNNLIITVCGNLTATPELKESKSGNPYFKIAIATNTKLPELDEEMATYYNLLFSKDVATENVELKKGEYIQIEGNLEIKPYQAKDGSTKLDNTIYVDDVSEAQYSPEDNIAPLDLRLKSD